MSRFVFPVLGVLVCSGLFFAWSAATNNSGVAEDHPASHAANAAAGTRRGELRVDVVRPRAGGLERRTTQPCSVHSFESADLYAKVSGYLKELPVDIGDRVKAGQVLAVIDVPELQKEVERNMAELERAKAGVDQMQAHIAVAQAEHAAAEATVIQSAAEIKRDVAKQSFQSKQYKRMKELFDLKSIDERLVDEKEDQFLASEAAVDVSNAAVATARAQVKAALSKIDQARSDLKDAEAQVHVVEANLEKSKVFLNYTKIVSPYDGVVTLRSFHRGDFIREAAAGHVPLLRVKRTDRMRVIVQIPDPDVPYIDPGDAATVEIFTLPGKVFKSKVWRCAESEEHETRTMRTEIDLENPDNRLRDGMYGRAEIVLQAGSKTALTIPSSALIGKSEEGKAQVYVVRDNRAALVPVIIGTDNGVDVEVLDGLKPGDSVIYRYNGAIGDNVPVAVSQAE